MLVKPHAGQAARIKVVGLGGGGGNALSMMISEEDIAGVEFVALNTDAQALLNHKADIKIQIGEKLTKGLGSGGDPEIGRQAAEESREKIRSELEGADMIFVAAGEGGGTGTGAAPIVAEVGKEVGALTVAVVTKPFDFEGARRQVLADEGIEGLRGRVDTLIVIPNQKVLEIIDSKVSVLEAFKKVDEVLHQGVKGIAELITTPGLINVDFADVRTIMKDAGTTVMGIGSASGDKRTIQAIKQAISSPLIETSIEGAKGVLLNIIGGPDLSMAEVDEAASVVAKTVDPDANIIFGAVVDKSMLDNVRVTVIATKVDDRGLKFVRPSVMREEKHEVKKLSEYDEVKEEEKLLDQSQETDGIDKDEEFDVPTFLRRRN